MKRNIFFILIMMICLNVYAESNQLTIQGNGNSLKDVNVGDIVVNNNLIINHQAKFNEVTELGFLDMIQEPAGTALYYNPFNNLMFLHYRNNELWAMNCYNGNRWFLGRVVQDRYYYPYNNPYPNYTSPSPGRRTY